MHNYTANEKHAVINARLVISSEYSNNVEQVADGLNELLLDSVNAGFIADYEFTNSDNPAMPTASASPDDGELLAELKTFLLIITNSKAFVSEHVRVETTLDLSGMSEEDVIKAVMDVVEVGDNDDVEVIDLSRTERVVL